ncbi:MBL fold metallo-hydrolase [Methylophaga sp. OBS3]|uniref:MBL fold metallo-hydrolase n=1 Tax=Methylophaga sp. OBS3 TaxID=2991934 RepID=UPI0022531151|nr:MBL fold metallo-hydrolase [Methylophaga sp. OBS3]MCX4189998.1 MBL fold metallo-hydrolase [Methylophaga sp. OBS3]
MQVQCFTVGAFRVNTYLVTDPSTNQSAIIDTGESDELMRQLIALRPIPDIKMILLTHGHLDHAGALTMLQEHFDVPTYLPKLEQPLFATLPKQGDWFGEPAFNRPCGRIDHFLDDGDIVQLGETELKFISTPGHTPGQGCYYDDQDIFVGDTLFAGSIGRYDLPMGDAAVTQESLKKLMTLPGHLRVHSGHGPVTTLSKELETNPYLHFLR